MSMHAMAFDSVLPVFLHSPEQQYEGNPDVKLPFKFTGGFGVGMIPYSVPSPFPFTLHTKRKK